ncbi:hypothetical protein C8R46DRAFT_1029362 [Mycena filopes]|nr:hypothetical protein C8R46DRAFT_1029362 [Mycena filopes]
MQFHTDTDPRLTATPTFRGYQWRSDAFVNDTWRSVEVDEATTKFFDTLLRLDREGFPPDSLNMDHATLRAHLGLPNYYNVQIDPESGYTSKGAGAFWISLLRFQVLDLLLSMAHGVSDTPSPIEPPPTATGSVTLLNALSRWPTFLDSLINKYAEDANAADAAKPSTAEAVRSLLPAGAVVPEAFTPLLALTDMHAVTLTTKTLKNFQAMGTALMWVLECKATNPFDIPATMKIGETFDGLDQDVKDKFKKLTVTALLRPLSYAINSSPIAAICNNDLSNRYGHVLSQYKVYHKTRAFIGRYRPPRLTYLEDVILTVVREVAIGKQVSEAAAQHWYPAIVSISMPPACPDDCDIFKIAPILGDPAAARLQLPHGVPLSRSFSRPAVLEFERPAPESLAFGLAKGICHWANSKKEVFAFPVRDDGDTNMNEGAEQDDFAEGAKDLLQLYVRDDRSGKPVEKGETTEESMEQTQPQCSTDTDGEDNGPALLEADNLQDGIMELTEEPASQSLEGDQVASPRPEQCVERFEPCSVNIDADRRRKEKDEDEAVGNDTNGSHVTQDGGTGNRSMRDDEVIDESGSQVSLIDHQGSQLVAAHVDTKRIPGEEQPEPLFNSDDHPLYGALSPSLSELGSTSHAPAFDDSTRTLRRSGRLAQASTTAPANVKNALTPKSLAKRKRSSPAHVANKKPKTEHQIIYPPSLDPVEDDPPKRSTFAVKLWGYRPDGFSKREFEWIGHVNTDRTERPMLEGIQRSVAAGDARCTQNGRRWCHHVDGHLPTAPPAENEFDLYVITKDQWQTLSPRDRVALWGTGRDLFIEGLLSTSEHLDAGSKLRSLHRLDESMEVQVPGLRIAPPDEEDDGDSTKCIHVTTLRTLLRHANADNGMVLNGLKLPETHTVLPNPLVGSGLDLADVAFRQTNGLPSFLHGYVPVDQQFFQIVGTPDTFTGPHYDKDNTRLTVEGPGEKYWMTRRDHRGGDLENAYAFKTWDAEETSLESGHYEGVILPPNGGTLLMQCREHIVVGLPPAELQSVAPFDKGVDRFTLVTGGHFVAASTIIVSTCMLLHLVMKEYVLTNVEHDGSWCILVRICAFWMDVTANRPMDRDDLAPYLPLLSENSAAGWMDIICLASVTILCSPFDRRQYGGGIPLEETEQRTEVCRMYKQWRTWLSKTFEATIDGNVILWEEKVFSAVLVHLAVVLIQYHDRERYCQDVGPDNFLALDNSALVNNVKIILDCYAPGLGQKLQHELDQGECQNSRFFLFKGSEITIIGRTSLVVLYAFKSANSVSAALWL